VHGLSASEGVEAAHTGKSEGESVFRNRAIVQRST
jgi:hypothetical protein